METKKETRKTNEPATSNFNLKNNWEKNVY
jgi:hypothetical protein